MIDPEEVFYAISLTQVPQIGSFHTKLLIDHFGSAKAVFNAGPECLEMVPGIGSVRAKNIRGFRNFKKAEKEMDFIDRFHISPLLLQDDHYPKRLKHCEDPPLVLFFKGNADLNAGKTLSVVGTRKQTEYGCANVEAYVEGLAQPDLLVISGLAYGIDQIAHRAALQHGLPTVGVLASGMNIIYPAAHTALAREMTTHGGLLTEFLSGTKPEKQNFPRRNRIVAGMCDALLVAETDIKGGSMITADIAAGYHREIFAIPGRLHDRKSAGCNSLIRDNKARLTLHPSDLLEQMNWASTKPKAKQADLFGELGVTEARIVQILSGTEPMHIDWLMAAAGLTRGTLYGTLLHLEMAGLIIQLPGGRWTRGT